MASTCNKEVDLLLSSCSGQITFGFDNTSHDGVQPALVAFVTGARARALREDGPDAIQAAVLQEQERYFGPLGTLTGFEIEDWSEAAGLTWLTQHSGSNDVRSASRAATTAFKTNYLLNAIGYAAV